MSNAWPIFLIFFGILANFDHFWWFLAIFEHIFDYKSQWKSSDPVVSNAWPLFTSTYFLRVNQCQLFAVHPRFGLCPFLEHNNPGIYRSQISSFGWSSMFDYRKHESKDNSRIWSLFTSSKYAFFKHTWWILHCWVFRTVPLMLFVKN